MAQLIELKGDGLVENLFHIMWCKDSLFKQSPCILLPDTIVYRFEQPAFWYFTSKSVHSETQGSILRKSKKHLNNSEIEKTFLRQHKAEGLAASDIVAVYIYNKKERNIVNVMNQAKRQQKLGQEEEMKENIFIDENLDEAEAKYPGMSIHSQERKEIKSRLEQAARNNSSQPTNKHPGNGPNHFQPSLLTAKSFEEHYETVFEYLNKEQLHEFLYTREKPFDGVLQRFINPKGDFN